MTKANRRGIQRMKIVNRMTRDNLTLNQAKLSAAADRLLAKAGYFTKSPEKREESVLEADAIGSNGQLRPTWQGRA